MSEEHLRVLDTDRPPSEPAQRVAELQPKLLIDGEHDLCPGCGEPLAIRLLLEVIEELGYAQQSIGVVGIGCYTAFTGLIDVDLVQALHGRAPSVATGAKRMRPDRLLFTLQGDGDMVNEGLQEVVHTAARGESVTCVLLNNGVFGETGGHMTATTALGQRTKNSLAGRDADYHGHPIPITELLAPLGGVAYLARGSVADAKGAVRTKAMLRKAFDAQLAGEGFSLVEVLTMCPTGWFVPTADGPGYLDEVLEPTHRVGEWVVGGKRVERAGEAAHARADGSEGGAGHLDLGPVDPAALAVVDRRARPRAERHLALEGGVIGQRREIERTLQPGLAGRPAENWSNTSCRTSPSTTRQRCRACRKIPTGWQHSFPQ